MPIFPAYAKTRDIICPAAAVAFYAFFSFWGLGGDITVRDEARFWLAARAVADGWQQGVPAAWRALTNFTHEPGRLLLLLPTAIWETRNAWLIRLPAAILNLVSLWPLYLILRIFYRGAAGMLLGAYCLLIGWIAVYALAITPGYSLFAIWLWYVFLRLVQEQTPAALLRYALVNSLAIFFYIEFAVFFIPAAAVVLWRMPWRDLWRSRQAWTALFISLASGALLASRLFGDPQQMGLSGYAGSRLQEIQLYCNFPDAFGFYAAHTSIWFALVAMAGLAYALCPCRQCSEDADDHDLLLWSALFFLPHLLVWGLFFRAAAYGHFAAAFPLFFVSAAWFAVAPGNLRQARILLFALACVLAFVQALHLFWLYAPPPAVCLHDRAWQTVPHRRSPACGMEEAGNWLRSHSSADESVITNGPDTLGLLYADRRLARDAAEAHWYVHFRAWPWLRALAKREMELRAETPTALIFRLLPPIPHEAGRVQR